MKNNKITRIIGIFAAALLIVSTSLSLAACNLFGQLNIPDAPTVNISDKADLPEYMQGLVQLDEIFKFYSYEGIDEKEMKTALLKAYIAATGDLYAEYLDAEEYEAYFSERAGEFVGVGVSVVNTVIEVNGYEYKVMQVISVFKDSPALEAGVQVGDCIMYIGNGDNKKLVNVLGYTEALENIRGIEGTNAEFTVFRPVQGGDYEEIEFSIKREKVESSSVNYRVSDTDKSIGIVNITGFDDTTPRQFTNAVDTLKGMGCDKFVFDLRNNPGGGLDSIIAVLSYFLNEGDLIVSVEYSRELSSNNYSEYVQVRNYKQEYASLNVSRSDIGKYKDLDCVVLVNGNSASAAELFTATMRDYGIAKIIGTTTFGKGSMQSLFPLEKYGLEGGLKLTIARYFSKSHKDYHDKGIEPDISVELSEEAQRYNFFLLPEDKDDQMKTAIAELLK